MALTTARKKANAKYEAKAYDKTLIRLPKGRLDEIRAHIEPGGESLNGFIGRAITEAMERDGGGAAAPESVQQEPRTAPVGRVVYRVPAGIASEFAQQTLEGLPGARTVSLPSETVEAAQKAAEAAGETLPDFVARAIETQAKRDQSSLRLGINPATGGKLGKE